MIYFCLSISIVSIAGFYSPRIFDALLFSPSMMKGQPYKFFSSCFIHTGWLHLIGNVFSIVYFGARIAQYLPGAYLLIIIPLSMVIPFLPSYYIHKHDATYHGAGASGIAYCLMVICFLCYRNNVICYMLLFELIYENLFNSSGDGNEIHGSACILGVIIANLINIISL